MTTRVEEQKIEEMIEAYGTAYAVLCRERDLSPRNPLINETLLSLVANVSRAYSDAEDARILGDARVRAIRGPMLEKLGAAETEMEFFYAEVFGRRAALRLDDLRSFPYWDHYVALVATEMRGLAAACSSCAVGTSESVAFVGAGPFPLSVFLLQREMGTAVTCLDKDETACAAAMRLVRLLGLEGQIAFRAVDGARHDYRRHPLVFVASLVPNKREVIVQIQRTRPGAVVALRSVDGVRQLLYEAVDEGEVAALGCSFLGRTIADHQIINSTLFYRV